jgi:hypothetical protein
MGTVLRRPPPLCVGEKCAGRNLAGFSQALIQHGFRPPLAGCAPEDVPPSGLSPLGKANSEIVLVIAWEGMHPAISNGVKHTALPLHANRRLDVGYSFERSEMGIGETMQDRYQCAPSIASLWAAVLIN